MKIQSRLWLVPAVSALLAGSIAAQDSARATSREITPADMKAWKSIRQSELSGDGQWFAYVVAPNEGNATVVVRRTTEGATETRIPVGETGGSLDISGDSRWLGYLVGPDWVDSSAAGGRGSGRGASGRAGGPGTQGTGGRQGADSAKGPRETATRFVVRNLASGEEKEFPRIRRFLFNTDTATWVALVGYPAGSGGSATSGAPAGPARGVGGGGGGGGTAGGASVMLYNLRSGELFNLGMIQEFAFDDAGDWLAYTMDTPDQVGNGVQLRNLRTNVSRAIDSERMLYRHLAWTDSSRALSVMRGKIESPPGRDTVFSILVFADFTEQGPEVRKVFDPTGRTDFPTGWKLASERAPSFSDDLSSVYFGIREVGEKTVAAGRSGLVQPGAPGAGGRINQPTGRGNADEVSLILWHAKDPRLQSQQIVQEQADRAYNYLSEYRFADDRFIRLANDSLRSVTVLPGGRYALGTDNRAYQQEASWSGRNYMDVYRVDLRTGATTLLQKKKPAVGPMLPSPDGSKILYWGKDGNYWVMSLATGDSVNITRSVPTSFVNTQDDHNNLFPPAINARGWSSDNSAVLLYDNWDLWKVPVNPSTGRAVNLTVDGKSTQVRYNRLYQFDDRGGAGGRFGGPANDEGVDLSRPLYVGTYGEWTKKEGLSRIDPGKPGAVSLEFDTTRINVIKARDADTFMYTRQNFAEYPDWWVFKPGFAGGYRVTNVNPQMKDLPWSSGARLINYRSAKGDRLQAAMYLPADFDPSKKYPMLVTIYEKRSQNMRSFVAPSETRAPDPALFTSRGYVVLDPDIVYRVNDPGMSAVWCVVPAVQAAIATGFVDAKKVGLWGHSWGGYQTAFLVTQTDIFAAAIAGAALTDMVSMYSSIYWNSGGTNQAIFESSQGRFKGNFTDNYDAYIRNSPVFHARNVRTPLLLLHNDKDGAVDFNQGITYFNTLRQLGKDVILLEYVGENHGLARRPNQKDYAIRMREWFDHYLKGAAPADWIMHGIPRIQMEEHLKEREGGKREAGSGGSGNIKGSGNLP